MVDDDDQRVFVKSDLYPTDDGRWAWTVRAYGPEPPVRTAESVAADPAGCYAAIDAQVVEWYGEPEEKVLEIRLITDGKRKPDDE